MKYTLEDLPHLEQEYQDRYRASVEQLETSLEAMDTLLQISQHRLSLESKENIGIEDINHINSLLRIGLGLESDDFGKIFPSLEDIANPEESMEYVDTTISEKLGYLGRVGINAVKGLGEFLRYSVNIINLLSKEYNASADLVGDFDKMSITLRNNEHYCYGDSKKQVKDIQSYIAELDKSTSLLITIADAMGQYTRDSFLDNLKVFAAYVTFTKDKVFNGMFDDLYKLTNKITDHPNMKKISDEYNYGFSQYESDVMLGMYRAEVTQMPKPKDPDYLSVEAKRKYAKVMKLSVSHYVTKKPVKIDPEIDFSINKKDVDKINDSIRPLLSSYDKFNSNLLRLTLAEKVFNVVEPIITHIGGLKMMKNWALRSVDGVSGGYDDSYGVDEYETDGWEPIRKQTTRDKLVDSAIRYIDDIEFSPKDIMAMKFATHAIPIAQRLIILKVFVNYNVLIRTSLMIIQTNHTIFSLLRGHIKNAIEINKKVAQQS